MTRAKIPRVRYDAMNDRRIGWSLRKRKPCLFLMFAGLIMIGATPERTIYSTTPNKELKARVFRLVKDIRELVYDKKNKDRELLAVFDKKNRPESRMDERKTLRGQWIRESDAAHDSFMREYKEKYWADAILLRNE